MSRLACDVDHAEEAELRRLEAGVAARAPEPVDALLSLLSDDESGDEAPLPPSLPQDDADAADALAQQLESSGDEGVPWEEEDDEQDLTGFAQFAPPPAPAVAAPSRKRDAAPPAPTSSIYEKATARESFSGIALSRRAVGDFALRETLERSGCRVLKLSAVPLQAGAPGPWATIGVLTRVSSHQKC